MEIDEMALCAEGKTLHDLNDQDDLMGSIFEFLYGSEIMIQIRLVCKRWYQLSTKVPLYFHSTPEDNDMIINSFALCEFLGKHDEYTSVASFTFFGLWANNSITVDSIFSQEKFSKLKRFSIWSNMATEFLKINVNFTNLTNLSIFEVILDTQSIERLINLQNLTKLKISCSYCETFGVLLNIFSSKCWTKLKKLNLTKNIIQSETPINRECKIVSCGFKPVLEKLNLGETGMSGDFLKHIISHDILSNLTILDLQTPYFGAYGDTSAGDAASAIANATTLNNLRILTIGSCESEGVKLIAQKGCYSLPNLKSIDWRWSRLDNQSFEEAMEYEWMKNLQLLFVTLCEENDNSYYLSLPAARAIVKNSKKMKRSLREAYEYYMNSDGMIDITGNYENDTVVDGPKLLGAIVNHGSDWNYDVNVVELLSELE